MIRTTALAVLLAASITAFASEEAKAKVDLAKAKTTAESVCVACHGADGNSPAATNPNLAGQIPEYLHKQLSNFKAVGDKPALRNSPIMAGMAAMLEDEDMKAIALYFSQQKLKPAAATTTDEKLIAEGQKIWRMGDFSKGVPACAGCHGAAGAGLPAQYPSLAGQYAEYTETQLKSFRLDERGNDPEKVMRIIAAKLSDRQIKAVSEYAAGLR
ncbi:MAG: c-type cytochrome [Rhodocyclaceae bacterium]